MTPKQKATGQRIVISRSKVSKAKLAWAAGLFVGEGHAAVESRKDKYLICAMSMNDRRAMIRWAKAVSPFVPERFNHRALGRGIAITSARYGDDKEAFRIHLGGRVAESVLRGMWPHLQGTDKGDQTLRAFAAAGLSHPSEELSDVADMSKKLTSDQVANILILCQNGTSVAECARAHGVSEGAVRYHLRQAARKVG